MLLEQFLSHKSNRRGIKAPSDIAVQEFTAAFKQNPQPVVSVPGSERHREWQKSLARRDEIVRINRLR
jgi:hypothetical protein